MDREKIFTELDALLASKKSKSFINHLVKAYMPISKVDKVFIKPKKVYFKCAVSKVSLVSVNDILKEINTDEFKDELFKYLHTMFDPNGRIEAPIKTLMKNKNLALQGTDTNTFMSIEGYLVFHDWVSTKILQGDKHILWLVSKANLTDAKGKKLKKEKEVKIVGATFALGDLPELQALKAKLEGKK